MNRHASIINNNSALKWTLVRILNQACSGLLLNICFSWSVLAFQDDVETPEQLGNDVVTYCIDPDWMPYEAIRNNRHVGISSDYFKLLSQYTGLEFQFVQTESWLQSLDFLRDGSCDLASMLNKTESRAEYMKFTDVYFTSPNVLVSLSDEPFLQSFEHIGKRRLALVQSYRIAEYVERYYPEIDVTYADSELDGLRMLAEGKVDLFVSSMLSVNTHIQLQGMAQLKVSGWAGLDDHLRIGVINSRADLVPILDAAISRISEQQHIDIYRNWNRVKIISEPDHRLVWQVSLAFLVLIILVVARNRYVERFNQVLQSKNCELEFVKSQLEQSNKELEYLSVHDPLTELYNRNYFSRHIKEEIKRMNRSGDPASLLVLDIDWFKSVNDEYGHSCGDIILKEFADILLDSIREIDIAARWGGEEFVVLCPQTSQHDALALAERIRCAFARHHFTQVGNITCSFGVADRLPKETFQRWFDRADSALYQAKQQGRNQICEAARDEA